MSVEPGEHLDHGLLILVGEHSRSSGVLDHSSWINLIREDCVELVDEVSVVDETSAVLKLISVDQLLRFLFSQVDTECANTCAESCLSTNTFAELVEVNKELFDTDTVLGDTRLNALFNIILVVEGSCLTLIVALMTMSCSAHVLHVVAD